jgi:DNA-binding XRE family transcriptional regulator
MNRPVTINHEVAQVVLRPAAGVRKLRLRLAVKAVLDDFAARDRIPAEELITELKQEFGDYYRSPGYYLRAYRHRADLTQAQLAGKAGIHQHHISEMEHNRRPMGKALARKLAKILNCEYQRFL